jgi:hypothetical protein
MDGVLNKLKNLDAYPKVNEDFFTRTFSGGVITVVSSLVMLCLFFSELSKQLLWLIYAYAQSVWHAPFHFTKSCQSICDFQRSYGCRSMVAHEYHQ